MFCIRIFDWERERMKENFLYDLPFRTGRFTYKSGYIGWNIYIKNKRIWIRLDSSLLGWVASKL